MLSVKLALFATLGLLAFGLSPAGAQPAGVDPARVEITTDGRCPDDQLATIKGIGADRAEALRRGLGYTFVLSPGTGHLTQLSAPEAPSITADLQAFEIALLFGRDEGSGKILIALRDRKLCGWVKPEVLLLRDPRGDLRRLYGSGPEPLTAGQMPGARNQQNPITIKIVLHNVQVHGDEGTPVYEVPGVDRTLSSRNLFDVFDVFAVKRAPHPKTKEVRNFYLAGRTPREASVRKTIIGWISEDDAYLWNTRVTAFWREGGDIAAYWTPEKMAKRASDGQVMIRRFLDDDPNRIARRFPIIDSDPNQATILKRLGMAAAGRSQDINKMIESYVVAMPFKTCKGGKGKGKDLECRSGADSSLDAERTKVGEGLEAARLVDILFLVDATKSMDPYFPAVRKAVSDFVAELNSSPSRDETDVRIAVATYGDYKGDVASPDQVQFDVRVPWGGLLTADLSRLDRLTMYGDKHEDKLEAPFAALIRAADLPRAHAWREGRTAIRFLVHIADHGNREFRKTSGQGRSKLEEFVTQADVASKIKGAKAIYVPIAVRGDTDDRNTYNATARHHLIGQARKLIGDLGGNAVDLQVTYSETGSGTTETDKVGPILKALQHGVTLSLDFRRTVTHAIRCPPASPDPTCREGPKTELKDKYSAMIIDRLTREAGLTDAEIANLYSHKQSVAAIHFPARSPSGIDTFGFWLAMDAASLNSLVRASNVICDTIDTTNAVANLRNALLNLIGDATRDTTMLKSPRDFFEQRLFIPGFHLDPLLTKTFEQLEDEFRDPEPAKTEERKQFFCKKAHQLTLLEQGQKVEDARQLRWVADTKSKRWTQPATAVKPYQWFYADEGGSPIYYVPLDFLP